MLVFEDMICKVEIVLIFLFILENRERFRVSFGVEFFLLLDIYKNIVESYEEIKQQFDIQMCQRCIRIVSIEKSEGFEDEGMGEYGVSIESFMFEVE